MTSYANSNIGDNSMHVWQLQEAKAKLSALVNESACEPQIISRRGINQAVVISMEQYRKFTGQNKDMDIVSFFQNSPLYGLELELERDKSPMRDVEDL
jgi:antitoxin Phd